MKNNLLDYLYEHIHLSYLSDLKIKSIMKNNVEFIKAIPEEDFSFAAWKETCEYLLGITSAETSKEAKDILIQWIES